MLINVYYEYVTKQAVRFSVYDRNKKTNLVRHDKTKHITEFS